MSEIKGLTADEIAEILTIERRSRGIEVSELAKSLCRGWWDTALMKLEVGGMIIVKNQG